MADKSCTNRNITDWGKYNDDLVIRGEHIWNLGFLLSWDDELEEMNRGKRGRPYRFPDYLFRFCCRITATSNIQLRMLEGMLRNILGAFGRRAPDHSTIDERCS
jgi:hypothetical protein